MKSVKISRRTIAIYNSFEHLLLELYNKTVKGNYNEATLPVTALAIRLAIEDKLKELRLSRTKRVDKHGRNTSKDNNK